MTDRPGELERNVDAATAWRRLVVELVGWRDDAAVRAVRTLWHRRLVVTETDVHESPTRTTANTAD